MPDTSVLPHNWYVIQSGTIVTVIDYYYYLSLTEFSKIGFLQKYTDQWNSGYR